ncbi:3-isopropylmalate dehydrogenase [Fictibacillus macauensis ZFHKF-1]|uniref:3-isopropylmalate dehydrogenase n=1 Tax=Fictibacillus macauensis ZFHKF-1 TaxID=1196324 RepID=I8AIR3_9BACL|nr:3-isopropylmalate dehydrogenase [Fictibacillus macauensis]EIT85369.1 3-isopropylmalate dehydrogenase [Fictibacillus macauensis ZFHKF-1]
MEKMITVLPGDGIGKEVMEAARAVLHVIEKRFDHVFTIIEKEIGGAAIDRTGEPLPADTLASCQQSDAILLGAVGGPKWEGGAVTPEQGLLAIRHALKVYANVRPVSVFKDLTALSPLKEAHVTGVDFIIVRELTGGLYFAKPKERRSEDEAVDTLAYHRQEITRIVTKAFQLARKRKKKLTSVDKANVLETSKLWREEVRAVHAAFPDVTVEHMLVDNAAMQLIRKPSQFDVIVTENMFGDILSDEASMITGSLGMLPSASLSENGPALYEPVHGSAPDLAGSNSANPFGMVLSVAMMLRHSFQLEEEAAAIELAVQEVVRTHVVTSDIAASEQQAATTSDVIEALVSCLEIEAATATIHEVYQ